VGQQEGHPLSEWWGSGMLFLYVILNWFKEETVGSPAPNRMKPSWTDEIAAVYSSTWCVTCVTFIAFTLWLLRLFQKLLLFSGLARPQVEQLNKTC